MQASSCEKVFKSTNLIRLLPTVRHLFDGHHFIVAYIPGLRKEYKRSLGRSRGNNEIYSLDSEAGGLFLCLEEAMQFKGINEISGSRVIRGVKESVGKTQDVDIGEVTVTG